MKLDDRLRSSPVVEAVDILRNNSDLPSLGFEPGFKLCYGFVTGIRLFRSHHLATVVVELPYQGRVCFESFRRSEPLSLVRAPKASCTSVCVYIYIYMERRSRPSLNMRALVAYLKVGTPLSALIPAPLRTTILLALPSASLNAFISFEGCSIGYDSFKLSPIR